ncbi:Multifunctional CCA protein [BD1-7 clade bacterium]|uniref:Multifunctional CCA protein n=1 Tax=BD1-7 clade bacterium TaxID=2029982 RepID=A0A5S9QR91_9GAMM|nr:Multifunctional CCA protein [BD1-7 clade bacterium]CAA0121413.1 Multifunctional CCA protein [BD1-7 clade bacterium]
METYLVGGAVRDKALGLDIKDSDWIVVGATPQAMIDQGYQAVGKDFPVFLHPKTKEEYALARIERKMGIGYTGFDCYFQPDVTLEQDLERRDLTINAMAESSDGELFDPYNGMQDLTQRKLRHVSKAFAEDPLRILRVARFAARFHHLGFSVAKETQTLMQTMSTEEELLAISPERIWRETEKALSTANPDIYIQVLRDCGALKILFPEIDAMFGVPQTETHHPEIDTGIHTLMVLQQASRLTDNIDIRFAALVHDLGKGITPANLLPKHHGHENTGKPLVKALCQRLKVPKKAQQLAEVVCENHLLSHRLFELRPATIHKLLKKLDAFRNPERVDAFLMACEADSRGRLGFEERPYPQANYLRACFAACHSIDARQLQQQGFEGKALGEAIERERSRAIGEVKENWPAT